MSGDIVPLPENYNVKQEEGPNGHGLTEVRYCDIIKPLDVQDLIKPALNRFLCNTERFHTEAQVEGKNLEFYLKRNNYLNGKDKKGH